MARQRGGAPAGAGSGSAECLQANHLAFGQRAAEEGTLAHLLEFGLAVDEEVERPAEGLDHLVVILVEPGEVRQVGVVHDDQVDIRAAVIRAPRHRAEENGARGALGRQQGRNGCLNLVDVHADSIAPTAPSGEVRCESACPGVPGQEC